mgnify:FL=1
MSLGGKLLGEGTYGCVFHPPIRCDNEKKRRSGVGKVVQRLEDAIDEIKMGKKLLKIDPKGKYSNLMIGNCTIKKRNITKKDEDKIICGATSTLNDSTSYKQIIYKYKGRDLSSTDSISFKMFNNLIEGIKMFQENNLCHRDIKEQNILDLDKRYVFIDFGLSCKLDEVFSIDNETILFHPYIYYPPEFKIFIIMKKLLASDETYYESPERLINDIFEELEIREYFKQYAHYKSDLKSIGVYKSRKGDVYNAIYTIVNDTIATNMSAVNTKKYFKKIATKVDIFSLGIVLFLLTNNNDEISFNEKEHLNKIIKQCIHMNVFERCTIDELILEFKLFLGKTNIPQHCTKHFSLATLKSLAKKHKMKVSGTKQQLYDRLSTHLKI